MENYAVSMKRVEEHNRQGTSSYQMGETRFADMTFEEFRSQYLGSDAGAAAVEPPIDVQTKADGSWALRRTMDPLPSAIDWRKIKVW